MKFASIFLIFSLFNQVFSSGIPIWELLTHEEKIGNLTFIFLRLVHLYCKKSNIPDCEKVLTLYGISNLLKYDERTLDLLDPNHRDASAALWSKVMSGSFDMPQEEVEPGNLLRDSQTEWERDYNVISNIESDYYFPNNDYDIDFGERYPHAVRVPAPPHFQSPRNDDLIKLKDDEIYQHSVMKPGNENQHHQHFNLDESKDFRRTQPLEQQITKEQGKQAPIKQIQQQVTQFEQQKQTQERETQFEQQKQTQELKTQLQQQIQTQEQKTQVERQKQTQERETKLEEEKQTPELKTQLERQKKTQEQDTKLSQQQHQTKHQPYPSSVKQTIQNSRMISIIPYIAPEKSNTNSEKFELERKSDRSKTSLFDSRNSKLSGLRSEGSSKTIYIQPSIDNREPILLSILRK